METIEERDIVTEMKESYLNYAMSVIVSRALPDVRDGLKPVHRRVLYGMSELGVSHNKSYKKCARIVGDVMGKFHPHGDSSVYESLVRMAQPWSLRYPLVDGQGNFGSVDGDNAAAMRYTEAKMSKIASEILSDLDKDTVRFTTNFDDSLEEPSVLPTTIPNLLINGSEGIAVGMATKVPPHNICEIIDGLIALIDDPNLTIEDLMEYIKGPDFPTGAYILGSNGIKQAYRTGRGKLSVRARATFEEIRGNRQQIVFTEIPYQANKALVIEKIAGLTRVRKGQKTATLTGISDVRDESDKEGMRLVVEVKRDAIPEVVLNNLYKHTQLQDTYGVILLSLVNGLPLVLTLKQVLLHFINFRHEIIVRRTSYELQHAEERAHIFEGIHIALENIDEVISLVRKSKDPELAKKKLIKVLDISEKQAKTILEIRLQRLTSMEIGKVITDYENTIRQISSFQRILSDNDLQMGIIRNELLEIKEKYGDERRTEIITAVETFSVEDMVADEDVIITITHDGYIKRAVTTQWKTQRRGGKGMIGASAREEDFVEHLFIASNHDYIMFFTDVGKCHWLKVHEIPEAGRTARGRAIINLIQSEEKIKAFVAVRNFNSNYYVVMATRNGLVKRTNLSEYSNPRRGGIYAINIQEDDELIDAKISHGNDTIILGTYNGKSIRFDENEIRPTGRKTMGSTGIKLSSKDDYVVGMIVVQREGTVLIVTEKGFGKRTTVTEYRIQHRRGKGVMALRTTEKRGKVIAIMETANSDDLMIITNTGIMIRVPVSDIRITGRTTQGVKVIKLNVGANIASVSRIMDEEESELNKMKAQREARGEKIEPEEIDPDNMPLLLPKKSDSSAVEDKVEIKEDEDEKDALVLPKAKVKKEAEETNGDKDEDVLMLSKKKEIVKI